MWENYSDPVIFNLSILPCWLDYNHLYMFGKSLHQQEYKVLRIGCDAGLSKQQISICTTVKKHWGIYHLLSPLNNLAVYVMERYKLTFMMTVKIFPDSLALDPAQKNL